MRILAAKIAENSCRANPYLSGVPQGFTDNDLRNK